MLFTKYQRRNIGDAAQIADNTSRITDRQQIIRILYKVAKNHDQLEVMIDGHPGIFNTTILGLNPKTGILAIDGISDIKTPQSLLTNKKLHLSNHKDGVELECQLDFMSVRSNSNTSYYLMSIPDDLVYVQRRNDYRVPLAARSQFRGYLELQQRQLVTGYAADISLQGLGVILKITDSIVQGDKITSCELLLPDETPIYFDLTICFVNKIPHRGNTRVGGQFVALKNNDKGRIAKIIRALERKHAQLVRN